MNEIMRSTWATHLLRVNRHIGRDLFHNPGSPSDLFSVFAHGHPEAFLKKPFEIGLGRVSAPFADLSDRQRGLAQKGAETLQSACLDLFQNRASHGFLELFLDVASRDMQVARDIRDGDAFTCVQPDEFHGSCDAPACSRRELRRLAVHNSSVAIGEPDGFSDLSPDEFV